MHTLEHTAAKWLHKYNTGVYLLCLFLGAFRGETCIPCWGQGSYFRADHWDRRWCFLAVPPWPGAGDGGWEDERLDGGRAH